MIALSVRLQVRESSLVASRRGATMCRSRPGVPGWSRTNFCLCVYGLFEGAAGHSLRRSRRWRGGGRGKVAPGRPLAAGRGARCELGALVRSSGAVDLDIAFRAVEGLFADSFPRPGGSSPCPDSNRNLPVYKTGALPTELRGRSSPPQCESAIRVWQVPLFVFYVSLF